MTTKLTFIIVFALILASCDGSDTKTQTYGVKYCPDGYCADGTFVSHWKTLPDGSRVWVEHG